MFALLALVMLALVVGAVVSVGAIVLRAAFWLLFLPVRLALGLLLVPFWIARTAIKVVLGAVMLPIVLVVGGLVAVVGVLVALVAVMTPLLPLLIVGLLLWAVFRGFRPALARRPLA